MVLCRFLFVNVSTMCSFIMTSLFVFLASFGHFYDISYLQNFSGVDIRGRHSNFVYILWRHVHCVCLLSLLIVTCIVVYVLWRHSCHGCHSLFYNIAKLFAQWGSFSIFFQFFVGYHSWDNNRVCTPLCVKLTGTLKAIIAFFHSVHRPSFKLIELAASIFWCDSFSRFFVQNHHITPWAFSKTLKIVFRTFRPV